MLRPPSPRVGARPSGPASSTQLGTIDAASEKQIGRVKALHQHTARWHPLDFLLGTKTGQFMCLFLVAVALNVLGALVWKAIGGNERYDDSWEHSFWFAWGMFFDSGTQMGFQSTDPIDEKVVAVFFSVMGFGFNLLFLGLIVELVRNSLEHLRRKRSRIIANDHTLVLGWTQKTLFLIDELFRCSDNLGSDLNIVILADEDAFIMKQQLELHFPGSGFQTRVKIRQGSPFECDELMRVSAFAASEIIVLATEDSPRLADLKTMRTMISLAALPKQPRCPVIAEVRVPETTKAVKSMFELADGVFARDAVRRILCMCAVQPDLGDMFESLITWDEGAEIYLNKLEDLGICHGSTVGEAQAAVEHGIILAVQPDEHQSLLAPARGQVLGPTDKLLILAESAGEISQKSWDRMHRLVKKCSSTARKSGVVREVIGQAPSRGTVVEPTKVLIIVGWPRDTDDVLAALEDYVLVKSRVVILSSKAKEEREQDLKKNRDFDCPRLEITHLEGDTTSISMLSQLPLEEASVVMVLADNGFSSDRHIRDAACIATVVTIDGLIKGRHDFYNKFTPDSPKPRLICEISTADTERALRSGSALRQVAKFFHTSTLETALFTIAARQPPVYKCLLMLLQRGDYGDIVTVPASEYYKDAGSDRGNITWEDCFARVRESEDVLIGVAGGETGCKGLHWDFTKPGPTLNTSSQLIVVTRHKQLLVHGESKRMGPVMPSTPIARM